MNEQQFFIEREEDWKRLNVLVVRADVSPAQLSSVELKEIFDLYRKVSGDLALVRTKGSNPQLVQFLNGLVGKAYGVIYRPPRRNVFAAIGASIGLAAQTVRRRRVQVFLSALVFVGAAILAFVCMRYVPDTRSAFVPAEWSETVEQWRTGDMDARGFDESTSMTGFYMSNNPRVAIITGALAASTFGVFTASLLFSNGALLGALAAELAPVDRLGYLFVHIMPHGVPELTGIVMSGAAGFTMGWALIFPGRRTRGDALKVAAKDALVLLCTAVVLMFIAAPIEGFFSFNPRVPMAVKALFALVSGAAWLAFWIGYAKTDDELKTKIIRRSRRLMPS